MCRLFGLTAGDVRVRATYWLLDAPDSMEVESRRNVDGSGLGWFDESGAPVVDKAPEPAYRDPDFVRDAVEAESSSFVAHVRWATTGARSVENTHPFTMAGRVAAHNGGFGDLALLEAELGDAMAGRARRHRLRALRRPHHARDRAPRRRRRRRDRLSRTVDRRALPGLVAQRRGRGARAAVGAALPGDARAARDRAPGRCRRGSPGRGRAGPARAQRHLAGARAVRCTRRRRSWSPPSGSTARTAGA